MDLQHVVQWTRTKIARLTNGDIPVKSASSVDGVRGRRVALPLFDLFEDRREFRLVVDVPGATPNNTRLAWNDIDTLYVHVRRAAAAPGAPSLSEYEELDWYREIVLSPDADGTKARSTVRAGILTIRIPKRRTFGSKLIPVYAA